MICLGAPTGADDVLGLLDILLSNDASPEDKQRLLQNQFRIPMTYELQEGGIAYV